MTPMRRFTLCSCLFVIATVGVTLWMTSSMWYPAGTEDQRNLDRLRRELGRFRILEASPRELRLFGDRLVLMLESDHDSVESLIEEYVGVLSSATWLNDDEHHALGAEMARRCLKIYLSRNVWDGSESERVIRSLVYLLPRHPIDQHNWSDKRQADLVMLLELWKRNQSVVDDSFDANDMFNQGLVSVRPPMNDVRYFEPQHVVLDVIHDHQRHELHKRQVAENDLIHHRISQQHNARRLDDALRQGLVGFVKYAFEEPPNCIGEAQSQFQKYEFQIPDQVGFFSDLHAQYEHVQDPRRENVQ